MSASGRLRAGRAEPYCLPLLQPQRRAGAAHVLRLGWIVALEAGGGPIGRGDVAPWEGFGAGAAAVAAALPAALAAVAGWSLEDDVAALAAQVAAQGWPPEVAHGIEQAALDLLAQRRGLPLAALLAAAPQQAVPVHALVPSACAAAAAVGAGHGAVKLKIGAGGLEDDIVRSGAVRAAIGGRAELRLDANGAWDVGRACRAARALAAFAPAWIEQPVAAADVDGLAEVRRCGAVPVAADEAVTDATSLRRLVDAGAVDVVILKPMFVGGLLAAQRLAGQARAAGVRPVLTHALESAVGRAGALHLAAACAALHGPAGLMPGLAEDLAPVAWPVAGALACPRGPGLGLAPLPAGATRVAVRPPC